MTIRTLRAYTATSIKDTSVPLPRHRASAQPCASPSPASRVAIAAMSNELSYRLASRDDQPLLILLLHSHAHCDRAFGSDKPSFYGVQNVIVRVGVAKATPHKVVC
jgi:hypothetical protein